jgi:hypothetical protein
MVTALVLMLSTSCARAPMPPPRMPTDTVACEGADQVRRNHDGLEVGRLPGACTRVACEGGDQVRRTFDGVQVSRRVNACTLSRCEGFDVVRRTHDGVELSRLWRGCGAPEPLVKRDGPVRFGLSAR